MRLHEPHSEVGHGVKIDYSDHLVVSLLTANHARTSAFRSHLTFDIFSASFLFLWRSAFRMTLRGGIVVRIRARSVRFLVDILQLNILLKHFDNDVECVALVELLLKADGHFIRCFSE